MENGELLRHYGVDQHLNIILIEDENVFQNILGYHQLTLYFLLKKEKFFLISGNKELKQDALNLLYKVFQTQESWNQLHFYVIDSQKVYPSDLKEKIEEHLPEHLREKIQDFYLLQKEDRQPIPRLPAELVYKYILMDYLKEKEDGYRYDALILLLNQFSMKYESIKENTDPLEKLRMQHLIKKFQMYYGLMTLFKADMMMLIAEYIDFEHNQLEDILTIIESISQPLSLIETHIF